ncbi:MAG: CHAT domain-containing protein, partial [Betaproteobacteria bacterium]|nr:CHAT domain-containing protein [Betaproteobacteria bacterium]
VISEMRERIAAADQERRSLFAALEKRFPAYTNLISPRPATVEQARATLREGEALLSVLVTDDRSYVWAVPKHGAVGFHAANLGEAEVGSIVANLRKALDPGRVAVESLPDFDLAAAHRLYAGLIKPVESVLNGARTLIVVANGALAQLPFTVLPTEPATATPQALRFEHYKNVPWLIKEAALVQLPAVNTLVTLRTLPQGNPARLPFAGFGDPQFGREMPQAPATQLTLRMRNLDIPRPEEAKAPVDWIPYARLASLPDTREEILAIADALKADARTDVFLGPAATKQNVKSADLSRRRIIAFATHGLIPGDFPDLDQPALALAALDGRSETGLLTLEEILQLKLDADWVVLSACNTAAGKGAGAEAISGLGRGFFYAGSRSLLVTHWPVETVSARMLVTNLFERYAREPTITRAESLRQASLAVMEESGTDPATNKPFSYAHPIFWAPYALVGDGGR